MKLLILLTLFSLQSFARLNADSQCPEGQNLERFTPTLTDETGSSINQTTYMCVTSVQTCSSVIKKTNFKSGVSNTSFTISEGFTCSQCQQQQQRRNQYQQQQGLSHQSSLSRVRSLSQSKSISNIVSIRSGDYINFNNKMYYCL